MTSQRRNMTTVSEHRVARAMLVLGDWNSPTSIMREAGVSRHELMHWLTTMQRGHRAERRKSPLRPGDQWRLTEAGNAFAIYARPDSESNSASIRYDHHELSAAMGMSHIITPPAGRRHHI